MVLWCDRLLQSDSANPSVQLLLPPICPRRRSTKIIPKSSLEQNKQKKLSYRNSGVLNGYISGVSLLMSSGIYGRKVRGKFSKTGSKTGPSGAFWANCKVWMWTVDFFGKSFRLWKNLRENSISYWHSDDSPWHKLLSIISTPLSQISWMSLLFSISLLICT